MPALVYACIPIHKNFVKWKISNCVKISNSCILQLPVEILVYRIGVGSPEKLAAAHLNDDRRRDTHKTAGFRPIADKPSSGDPPRKIP
jgi:hypothetical protein